MPPDRSFESQKLRNPSGLRARDLRLTRELRTALYEKSDGLLEILAVRGISLISNSAVLAMLLIFTFVTAESLPVILQQMNNARSGVTLDPNVAVSQTPAELARFLQTSEARLRNVSPDILRQLVEIRNQEIKADTNPDSKLNTTSWRMLLLPYQWRSHTRSEFIWQPTGPVEKFNIVPLLWGTLKVTAIALFIAVPFSVMAAIYISQLSRPRAREFLKPLIELLAGVPSVVLGFIGLIALSSLLSPLGVLDSNSTPLNAFVAGVALAFAVIPVIFTIAEDAISAVPVSYKNACRAMGATEWHASMRVVVPIALPGIAAAVVLGCSRAIGDTMIVLLASGNAANIDLSVFRSVRTAGATIASELNEAAFGSAHYHILFLLGTILFVISFCGNLAADLILRGMKAKLEGAAVGGEFGWEEQSTPLPAEMPT